MTKDDINFEEWFDLLQLNLSDYGIRFEDSDSVRSDYNDGKSLQDVVDDISSEYK